MKLELTNLKCSALLSSVENISSYPIIISQLDGIDGNLLQSAALDLVSKLGNKASIIIGGIPDKSKSKVLFVACFGSEIIEKGLHAGELINKIARICSGGGGGKSNIAQAGAKNIDKLSDALFFAKTELLSKLSIHPDK